MSRGGLRRKKVEQTRPSTLFIVVLTIAVLLLLWGAWDLVHRPVRRTGRNNAVSERFLIVSV